MRSSAEVVIVGGGVMGASIAYHLARKGCRDVLLLDRAEMFGMGSSGLNAGGIRHQFSTEVNIELSKLSISMLERFQEEMGQAVDLNFCGYLFLLDTEPSLAAFRRNVALQRRLGVETELLEPGDIARLIPQFNLDRVIGGTFYHRDGLADPSGVVNGYIGRARGLGASLETGVEVVGLQVAGDKVQGVETSKGRISTRYVVIAAGPWSAAIGRMAGVDLPVQPIRRQIAVTRPLAGINKNLPFTVDFSNSLYFHHESGGILTGMSNPAEKPGMDTRVDPEWSLVHFERAMTRLPLLESAEILTEWAGLYEVTPDDQPILGRLPQLDGLVACAGFSGHGFMHGPAAGLVTAEEIVDGRAHTINIDALRWNRFEKGTPVGEYAVI